MPTRGLPLITNAVGEVRPAEAAGGELTVLDATGDTGTTTDGGGGGRCSVDATSTSTAGGELLV